MGEITSRVRTLTLNGSRYLDAIMPSCLLSENLAAGAQGLVCGMSLASKILTLGRRRRKTRRDFSFFSLCRRFPVFKFHILENEIRAFP
jgi:hypothetical protein